jgi:hypothetical protein
VPELESPSDELLQSATLDELGTTPEEPPLDKLPRAVLELELPGNCGISRSEVQEIIAVV